MNKTRTGSVVAAVALVAATTVAAAPAHAAPATTAETGVVQYETTGLEASVSGSLEDPAIQAGLVLVAGLGVSIALAVGAGLQGGAFEIPQIPGLPF